MLTREGANPKTLTMMAQMSVPMWNQRIYWQSAHNSGCCHLERPGLACAEDSTFYSR